MMRRFQACSYCGKTFGHKQKLRYHLRLHTGEGLLHCGVCGKACTNAYDMKEHLASVHGETAKKNRRKQHDCTACGTRMKTAKALEAHLAEAHPDIGNTCEE